MFTVPVRKWEEYEKEFFSFRLNSLILCFRADLPHDPLQAINYIFGCLRGRAGRGNVSPMHKLIAYLVLGSITNEPLGVSECHVARRRAVALLVGDDLDAVMLPHADTTARKRGRGVSGYSSGEPWTRTFWSPSAK